MLLKFFVPFFSVFREFTADIQLRQVLMPHFTT